jgi:NitT/TauT family transport system substrate-binding protein
MLERAQRALAPRRRRPLARSGWAAAALAVGLVALSACGGGSGNSGGDSAASDTGSNGNFNIVLGSVTPTANTINIFVAQQEGFLAKNHLNLDFKQLSNSLTVMSGLGHSYDMAFGFLPQEIIARGQGIDLTVVTDLAIDDPTHPGSGLIVPAGSSIKSLSDLPSQTVGCVGLTDDLYEGFQYELYKAGIDPSKVKGIAVPSAAQQAELSAKKISAAVGTYPFITEMENAGMKDLGDPLQAVGKTVSETNLVTTTAYAQSHKKQMAELRTALDETNAWIPTHLSQVIPILVKWSGQSEAASKAAPLPSYSTAFTQDEFNQWITVLKTVVPNFQSTVTYQQLHAGMQ